MSRIEIGQLLIIAAGICGLKGFAIPQIALASIGLFMAISDIVYYIKESKKESA